MTWRNLEGSISERPPAKVTDRWERLLEWQGSLRPREDSRLDFFISRCQGLMTHGTHAARMQSYLTHTHTHTLAFDPIQVKVWDLVSGLHADATPELTICPFGRTPDLLRLSWASLISSLARCHKRHCHLTASKCKHLKCFWELSWQLKSPIVLEHC